MAFWRLFRSYGVPYGWRPDIGAINAVARRNYPLAAADAIEWSTRRLDIAILGLFAAPYWVGIYYVAQQVASVPQKLKTSFDPILAPVITQKLAEDDKAAVAQQVRQVGFWIIAAQTGIALALGMTGAAVMGLVGPQFPAGAAALAFLLAAEAVAATAVVSEAALVYIARHRNLLISLLMIVAQAAITVAIIVAMNILEWPADPARRQAFQAAGAALGLALALGLASVLKARLLGQLLGAPVQGWRWSLIWAAAAAIVVGTLFNLLPHSLEWLHLSVGAPAILFTFGYIVWRRGLTKEDRALFRRHPPETPTLPPDDCQAAARRSSPVAASSNRSRSAFNRAGCVIRAALRSVR